MTKRSKPKDIYENLENIVEKKEPVNRKPVKQEVPIPISKSVPELPKVIFKVFSQISGVKWDQLAGLEHYARKQGIIRLTIPEWQALHLKYKVKPVK